MNLRSFRFKLAAMSAAIAAIVLLAFAIAAWVLIGASLRDAVDQRLYERGMRTLTLLRAPQPADDPNRTSRGLGFAVPDSGDGPVTWWACYYSNETGLEAGRYPRSAERVAPDIDLATMCSQVASADPPTEADVKVLERRRYRGRGGRGSRGQPDPNRERPSVTPDTAEARSPGAPLRARDRREGEDLEERGVNAGGRCRC